MARDVSHAPACPAGLLPGAGDGTRVPAQAASSEPMSMPSSSALVETTADLAVAQALFDLAAFYGGSLRDNRAPVVVQHWLLIASSRSVRTLHRTLSANTMVCTVRVRAARQSRRHPQRAADAQLPVHDRRIEKTMLSRRPARHCCRSAIPRSIRSASSFGFLMVARTG